MSSYPDGIDLANAPGPEASWITDQTFAVDRGNELRGPQRG